MKRFCWRVCGTVVTGLAVMSLLVFGGQWQSLGGGTLDISGTPTIASWGPDRLDVVARSGDKKLWVRSFNGQWGPWLPIPNSPTFTRDPDCVSRKADRVDCVSRNENKEVVLISWNGTKWSFDNLGGLAASDPTIASWGPNRLDVFVRSSDNKLWIRSWAGNSWGPWLPLPGELTFTSSPDCTSRDENLLDCFVVDNDQLWHIAWNGSNWTPWFPLGELHRPGGKGSQVTATSWGRFHLVIFSTGKVGPFSYKTWDGQWSDWTSIERFTPSGSYSFVLDIDCVAPQEGRVECVVKGPENEVWKYTL